MFSFSNIHTSNKLSEASTCEYCSESFQSANDLRTHYEIHTIELLKLANVPISLGASSPNLFVCRYCGEWYFKRNHLIVHEREHTGRAFFKCNQCTKAFINSSKLKRHEETHRRARATRTMTRSYEEQK